MSATFEWIIEWMNCKPVEGSYTDVVVTAGWRCNGAQTQNGTVYTGTSFSICSFPMPASGGQFTPYDQLTQQQVLGWCWANGVNQADVEANVQGQIDAAINPPVVQLPLPWVPQPQA